ncbi:MAG: ABC transporter ATP-binding protein [Candidatus Aenigmarchaeota archaeon]|nr:ABC transporter ATP-binding protein [Candidatus Aenigmarchaeota archaeon]
MEPVTLEAKDLAVGVEKFRVSGISFSLCGGDILGLVGRSGEGKSILIKTLTGLRRPLSGKITVKSGDSETGMAEIAGYSPQDNALFPFLTVEENIATFAELHGVKRKELEEKTSSLLKRLGLEKSRKKRIIELSGGMRKRADLAAALIQDPSVIILDEPFNGLDVSVQQFVWELLADLAREDRIIIISSHILGDMQKRCTKFGLVLEGKYYGTERILEAIREKKAKNLEGLLNSLFSGRLAMEEK